MKVSIQGLKSGLNFFDFEADVTGILPEISEFGVHSVCVRSKLDKGDHNILVVSKMTAVIDFICDNCLNSYRDKLLDEYSVFYTTDKSAIDDDEMVRFLSQSTSHIDLTEGLRESILVSLPMRHKCSVDCKGLCDQCGANLNDGDCCCEKSSHDPRWDGLKKLLDNGASAV